MRNQIWDVTPFSGPKRENGHLKIAILCAATILLTSCEKPRPQGGGNPVGPGQPQDVLLVWKPLENKWKVRLNNGQEQEPSKATTVLEPGTGPTTFTVHIAGKQVGFKDPGGLTVWKKSETGSPKSGPQGSTQILGPIITKQGKMIFYDLNQGDPVTIYYSLNLDNGEKVDPIIDNRGG